jgi:transposase-like protein
MSNTNGASKKPAETELGQKPAKRVFPPEYKRRIVEEINAAPKGGIAAILRREGLYSTTVDNWRRELSGGFEPKKRGRKPSPETPVKRELERLARENERLRRKLEHAELIIDVQKKVARMFEPPPETDDRS